MRTSTYWICQIGGWSFYAIVGVTIAKLFGALEWSHIVGYVFSSGLGLVLTHQYRRFIRRNGWTRLRLRHLIPRGLAASVVIAAIISAIMLPLILAAAGDSIPLDQRPGFMFVFFFNQSVTALGWSLIYFSAHYVRDKQEAETDRWRLRLSIREMELAALRSQLNPHFLFNSLNSLRALILENPTRAQQVVTQLSGLLRYALHDGSRASTVALSAELEAVRAYLELEAVRLEERLRYSIDIGPDVVEVRVPPMLLQTLVENAIKHGIARRGDGGEIDVRAWREGPNLRLRVANTGTLESNSERGVGLANSRERLRLLFGKDATLRLDADRPDRVVADVRLPLEFGSAGTSALAAATAVDADSPNLHAAVGEVG